MRLEKIKLAGFKSFVDPTTVHMPSNLVGVVGPNGCGKSNVIDAVRWVMGESSAKMLRGESMADVIFNGSNSRKPVGTATIELVFDNSDGGAGGQYAEYNQISVKRQVSRDGQSSYFLNNIRCRRRDITDLFLGTGLGPRSYSIIEQGMISRFIEARPEELRIFLEEAAGISRYKERRRETENRISHTRENLDRLNDLRDEVAKQLQHLKRQAATAEKYKELKKKERRTKAELLALRWCLLETESKSQMQQISERETAVQAAVADQRRLESEIEIAREQHTEINEDFNNVQGRYYATGAEISSLEQAIQFAKENRRKQEEDLSQVNEALQESNDHFSNDNEQLAGLNESLLRDEPKLAEARRLEEKNIGRLQEAEQRMHEWQNGWDSFNQEANKPAQVAQVERTRLNHLEQQADSLKRREQRLDEEFSRLSDDGLSEQILTLESEETALQEQLHSLQSELEAAQQRITHQRSNNAVLTRQLDELRAELQAAKGRRASLETLQQAALGKQQQSITSWLEQNSLSQASRLAEHLEVEPRWQQAVEIVLGHYLQAVCVEQLDDLARLGVEGIDKGVLTLFETRPEHAAPAPSSDHLSSRVKAPWSLDGMLGRIRLADDLGQALTRRTSLSDGESIITPDGVWLGSNWLRLVREQDETSGVLAREQELKQLEQKSESLIAQGREVAEQLQQGEATLHQAEQQREQLQQHYNEANRKVSEIRQGLSGKRARAEQLAHRRDSITHDKQEVVEQIATCLEGQEEARLQLHKALEEMESLAGRRETLVQQRDTLRAELEALRQKTTEARNQAHQLALQIGSMRSSRDSISQSLERTKTQLAQLEQRQQELQQSLQQSGEPLQTQQEELAQKLERRFEVEKELTEVRAAMEKVDAQLRTLEQQRHAAEQQAQERHQALEAARLSHQEVKIRANTFREQLNESKFDPEQLFEELPEEASVDQWQQEVERQAARIQRLGPINLAAISEYEEQSERMEYLDAQHTDISESLETLENAIRKIDRETRTRFKETFDKVNNGLQAMFPKLFGGGHAYLQLTGDDLLDTGVAVMARPPGKRNTSIHLLSGGEKALTAVALVFAIFELNPAPFCMLDEVDAPLDDANVGRFCNLVRSMSERVQFIFITHNKITMEIANQLTGITMHEPGVSRLVSVDVEEAAQLAVG